MYFQSKNHPTNSEIGGESAERSHIWLKHVTIFKLYLSENWLNFLNNFYVFHIIFILRVAWMILLIEVYLNLRKFCALLLLVANLKIKIDRGALLLEKVKNASFPSSMLTQKWLKILKDFNTKFDWKLLSTFCDFSWFLGVPRDLQLNDYSDTTYRAENIAANMIFSKLVAFKGL